jgi:hypothetical protein
VDNNRKPLPTEEIQRVHLVGAKGLEELLQGLGLVDEMPDHEFEMPCVGDTWKHHNGIEYEVVLVTNQYSDRPEYQTTVSFVGANGKAWSKTLGNFLRKMTFVRRADAVPCGILEAPSLGIVGIRAGNIWPVSGEEDTTPQADIDIQYSPESKKGSSADGMWYGAILINGQDTGDITELRDLVLQGLRVVCGGPVNDKDDVFAQDQWWVSELETLAYGHPVTLDQSRAAATAINLARSVLPVTLNIPEGSEAEKKFIEAWGAGTTLLEKGEKVSMPPPGHTVHPLLQILNDKDQMALVAKRATEMQLATIGKARCPDCDAAGKQYRDGWITCDTCNGTKLVDVAVRDALEALGDKPKTYGCNHVRESCMLCYASVMRWRAKRAEIIAQADPAGDHMFERFIRPCE